MQETKYFLRKRILWDSLISYGFTKEEESYRVSKNILDNQFQMIITVTMDEKADANIDTKLIDLESGEEYVLHRVPGTSGPFVGAVREVYDSIMCDISDKCFEMDVFKSEQAKELIQFVKEKYSDELEYLWKKFPDNAVWRRKDNRKWYAALLSVSRRKLGIDSDEMVEIIDLRVEPEKLKQLLEHENYFPGWHMRHMIQGRLGVLVAGCTSALLTNTFVHPCNPPEAFISVGDYTPTETEFFKLTTCRSGSLLRRDKKNWYTMILDETVPIEEIKNRLEHSYALTV